MNKNKRETPKKKFAGPVRVRREEPVVEEAIFAAQGLTDDPAQQLEIAASLIGLPIEEVRAAMLKMPPPRREPATVMAFAGPASSPRAVVVERKTTRQFASLSGRRELLTARR